MNLEKIKIKRYNERYAKKAFLKLIPGDVESWNVYKQGGLINKRLSKTIYYGNKPVGIYILGKIKDLEKYLIEDNDYVEKDGSRWKIKVLANLKKYKNKTGIVGIGLYIEPEFREYGLGKMLIEYAESCSDYVFGGHDVKLNNLKYWLTRRKLIAKSYLIKNGRRKLVAYYTATPL